jgi:uncharacterized protein involved in copper resistance
LILQSKVETNLAEAGSDAEFGLRLRYEIRREFAPYVGALRHRTVRRRGGSGAGGRCSDGRDQHGGWNPSLVLAVPALAATR